MMTMADLPAYRAAGIRRGRHMWGRVTGLIPTRLVQTLDIRQSIYTRYSMPLIIVNLIAHLDSKKL